MVFADIGINAPGESKVRRGTVVHFYLMFIYINDPCLVVI